MKSVDQTIFSGGARGVDTMAVQEADAIGLITVVVNAPWTVRGRAAGPMRNAVVEQISDRCIAFWDGQSPGTRDTMARFEKAGKRVDVIRDKEVVK